MLLFGWLLLRSLNCLSALIYQKLPTGVKCIALPSLLSAFFELSAPPRKKRPATSLRDVMSAVDVTRLGGHVTSAPVTLFSLQRSR